MVPISFNLPEQAFVNKFIPKNKFYEKASLSNKLQKEFVDKIQKITWLYKLAHETIGIEKTDKVTEIQIFSIELKGQEIPEKALKVIDKAIPYQILYLFTHKELYSWGITLKESNKAENYYFSDWNEPVEFDFTGITLEKVYQKLVKAFIDSEKTGTMSFDTLVATDSKKKQLESDILTLENKIRREKQFNRKVDLNKMLLTKKNELLKIQKELSQ